MKSVRIFWDLDKTLLDTEALLRPVLACLGQLVGRSPESVRGAIDELDAGGFTWLKLLEKIGVPAGRIEEALRFCENQYARAGRYLYPGALEAIRELDPIAEHVLVTFGDPTFQRLKWNAIPELRPYFRAAHFVDGVTLGKGALIASYDATGMRTFFVDDSGRWHVDCERHAPHVVCVLMRFAPGEAAEDDVSGCNHLVHTHEQVVSLIRRLPA